jgi:hypothetical protein
MWLLLAADAVANGVVSALSACRNGSAAACLRSSIHTEVHLLQMIALDAKCKQ